MKNIIIIFVLLLLGLTSCQDVLNVSPDGRQSVADMFKAETTTGAYLNSCYQYMPADGLQDYFWTNYRIGLSDDAYHGRLTLLAMYNGSMTSQNNPQESTSGASPSGVQTGGVWLNFWQGIRCCNIFLAHIDSATVTTLGYKKRWKAEARVLRAFYNFELIKRYGPLPIITSELGISSDYSQLRKPTFKECVDNIIQDCDSAITYGLPEFKWRASTASEGYRMNAAKARAIQSEAMLFAASPLWNDGNNYWTKTDSITLIALNDLLDNLKGGYALYSTVRNPSIFGTNAYQEYLCSAVDFSATPIDKETIMASKTVIANWYNIQGVPIMNPVQSGLNPTQELVDAYGMKTTGKPVLNLAKPYNDDQHLSPNYNTGSGYDPQNPYLNRDPRFYATVYYNGSTRKNRNAIVTAIETFQGGNCSIDPGNIQNSATGYYPRKYDHPNGGSPTNVNVSYKIYRLAEMYLNYAEAANENGHTTEAINAINTVRKRSSMPLLSAVGLSKDDARLLIRNERRVELAFEENRYFDNRRYVTPDADLSSTDRYVTGMWILRSGTAPNYTYTYMRCVVNDKWDNTTNSFVGSGQQRECYSNKYLRWPIPFDEAKRLYGVTGILFQNPGW